MPSWLRISATTAALVLALPLISTLAAYGWLQTGMGRHWLASRLETALGGQVEIAGLGGRPPFRLTVDRIAVADADGPWLVAERSQIAIDPRALLGLELRIQTASAERLTVLRAPRPATARGSTAEFSLPTLPFAVSLERLEVPHLILAAPVLGREVDCALTGMGSLSREGAIIRLALDRSDAPGHGAASLHYDRPGDRLALDVTIEEPSGLLAGGLGASEPLPLTLHAAGSGTLADWHGTVAAKAGAAKAGPAELDLDLIVTGTGTREVSLTGRADPRPLLPRPIAELMREPVALEAGLTLGDRAVLHRLHAVSGASRLVFDGTLDLADFSGSGQAELVLPEAGVLRPVLAVPVGGVLALTADLTMGTAGQTAKLQATGTSLVLDRYRVQSAALTATVSRPGAGRAIRPGAGSAIHIDAALETEGVSRTDPASGPALPSDLRLGFAGTIGPDLRSLDAERLTLSGAGAELAWSGTAATDGALDGRLEIAVPDVAALARLLDLPLRGDIAAKAALSAAPGTGRTQVRLDGTWSNPASGIPAVDALLGPALTLAASGTIDDAGSLTIDRVKLEGAATLLASGRIDIPGGAVDARYAVELRDMARLGAALGKPLSGSAHVEGTVAGKLGDPAVTADLSSPALAVADLGLRDLKARITAAGIASRPGGTVAAALVLFGQPARLDTGFALEGRRLALPDLKARVGKASVAGALAIGLDEGAVQGKLDLDAPDLAPWSPLAGAALVGSARGTLTLTPTGGLEAGLTGTGVAAAGIRAASLNATARLQPWQRDRRGTVAIELKQVRAGSLTADSAVLRLQPQGDNLPFSIAAGGTAGAPFDLTLSGTLGMARKQVRIAALEGRFADRPLRLDGATGFSFGQGVALDPFTLRWGDARIAGNVTAGTRLSGRIDAVGLPLGPLGALAGLNALSGTGRMTVTFSGTAAAPAAKLEATLAGVRVEDGSAATPAGDATLVGTLGRDGLDWQAKLAAGEAGLSLAGSGRIPLRWTEPPFGFDYQPTRPMTAKISGSGLIAPVVALVGVGEDRARGRFTVDLTVTGTPSAPVVAGTGRIVDGSYENFASGAVLRDLTLDAVGERDRLRLKLAAKDGSGGEASAEGALELSGTALAALQLDARLTGFRVMRSDEIEARASGTLALTGPLDALALSGSVRMDQVAIHIPEKLPVRVAKLDVVEVNGAVSGVKPPPPPRQQAGQSPAIEAALAIDVGLPSVAIDGRGLRSQWHGGVHVAGTTVKPRISGGLKLDRGSCTLLGKVLPLKEGRISFDGQGGFDPALRVVAEQQVPDATVRATLSGTLTSPLLDLSSTPPLPEEEVLSRLLFGKSAGDVGPAQTLQLAQAAAELSGTGSATALNGLQKLLGVDRLDVTSTRTVNSQTGKTTDTPSLAVGKDITDSLHVGVQQGAASGTGAVNVEVDLNRNLSVQSTVGQQGNGGVGLRWRYDY